MSAYVVADVSNLKAIEHSSLRQKAKPLKFPLSEEDNRNIKSLVNRFVKEKGSISGLAAPQLGISKCVIIFAVKPFVAEIKHCEPFPKTVWINPFYEKGPDDGTEVAYEHCLSVKEMVGTVKRYKSINYKALDLTGKPVEGVAYGYLARVIQHEVDHLNGILFVDLCPKSDLMTINEYFVKQQLAYIKANSETK